MSPKDWYCRECRREYNRATRERTGNKGHAPSPERNREYRRRFPERHNAQEAVQRALKAGLLIRPTECEECGKMPAPRKNGASGIVAHHPDYTKPLDVTWLCQSCHMLLHNQPVKVAVETALKFS